jgi:phage gp36-like protein
VSSVNVNSVYISDAESYIDAFLSVKYVTPITPVSPLITMIASDLAIFHLLSEKLPTVPEFMDKRFARANDILTKLRDGKMQLVASVQVSSHGDSFAWSSTQQYHPIFSPVLPETMQRPDSIRVSDDEGVRANDIPPLDGNELIG